MLLNIILSPNIPLYAIVLFVLGFIFTIGFHEFAHAKSAQLFGDMTPVYQGRVTLNPIAHLDPIGTLAMFFLPFGWGKPVEVNPQNMGMYPERKYFISSILGPISNLFLAFVLFLLMWGFMQLYKTANFPLGLSDSVAIFTVLKFLFSFNIVLAIFNLIPIPPLDGSKIWGVALPYNLRMKVEPFIEKYSLYIFILIALPIIPIAGGTTSIAGLITSPLVNFLTDNILGILN